MAEAIRTILVPVDGSDGSRRALEEALLLARTFDARLIVLEVIEEFGPLPGHYDAAPAGIDRVSWLAEERFRSLRAALDEGEVRWERMVEQGYPAQVICEIAEAEGADLIVMGHRGLSPVARFLLGSVSDKVVRNAACSVMVAR